MADNKNNFQPQIWIKNIEDIMSDSFGKYAKYIIQDRALPDVRDGLKPVQRRILYAMNGLQLYYDKPHKKSARTVGEVIGKYHPHGDSSIYEAMVRMSQTWKNNLPLLDMHGNNGSIDGDSPAAMRYTECRLALYGQTMLDGLLKDTVTFIPNFDDSEVEPSVLPTLIPNLLINGVSGIAAGYATNIPPFNLGEVIDAIICRIDAPNCRLETISKVLPGPDFPTGGIILNASGIMDAYSTGKGKISIRCKIELAKNRKQAFITEIPYETSKANLVKNIDELRIKYDFLNITEVRDESDRNGLCIAIDLKHDKNFEFVKNFLFKNTQLQTTYSINMVAIKGRKPYIMPMLMIFDAFIEHANQVIISSSKFDLDKSQKRLEILNGLVKAIRLLDDVIELIRRAEGKQSAKERLIEKFSFSEPQAEAIVNLRLYRLSSGDITLLKKEIEQLELQVSNLQTLLDNSTIRNNFLKAKLREFKKVFAQPRKSEISDQNDKIEIDEMDVIEDKTQVIVVSRDGYLKSISNKSFVANEYQDLLLKENDIPIAHFDSNQRDKVVLITNKGHYICIPTHKIKISKWKEMGAHFNNIVAADENEKIIAAFNFTNVLNDERNILLATKNGMIKLVKVESLNIGKNARISACMGLNENDEVIAAQLINQSADNQVCIVTKYGSALIYPLVQVPTVGKNAVGVKAISLKNDDEIASAFIATNNYDLIAIIAKQGAKRIKKNIIQVGKRNHVGRNILSQIKSNPIEIISAFEIKNNEMINLVNDEGKWEIIKATELPLADASTRVKPLKMKQIVKASKNFMLDTQVVEEEQPIASLFEN